MYKLKIPTKMKLLPPTNRMLSGIKKTHLHIKKLCRDYFLISLIFLTIIILISDELMLFIYGDIMLNYTYVLIFFCVLNLINCFQYPISAGLRSLKYTKPLFSSYFISSIFTLIFAYPLISIYQLEGFLVGLLINQIVLILLIIFGYFSFIKSKLKI